MATNFPSSQDSFTNPTTSDTLATVSHSGQHADANDAIEAIELALLDGAPLHIDDTNERVGVGTTSPVDPLHVIGDVTIEVSDGGSAAQPEVTLHRGSTTPADGDYLGQVKFSGENDNGQTVNYAKITGKISDVTDGTEDGLIEIANIKAGSQSIGYRFTSTDLKLLNGRGLEVDGDVTVGGSIYHDVSGAASSDPVIWVDAENIDVPLIRVGTDAFSTSADHGMTLKYRGSGTSNNNAFDVLMDNQTGSQVTALSVLQDGKVGIGTTSPAYTLDVVGTINATGNISGSHTGTLDATGYSTTGQPNGSIKSHASGSTPAWSSTGTSDSTRNHLAFSSPSYPWVGAIYTSSGNTYYANYSDYRLKDNVAPLDNASNIVANLNPISYTMRHNPEATHIGFLAHELQEHIPSAVGGTKDEVDDEGNPVYQNVDLSKVVPVLTAALQEALTTINDLTARIEALEAN